jgi:uncharacterized protein with GYD domain
MGRYVSLINWTDQGIRNYKDTRQRAEAFGSMVQGLGGRVVDIYWTQGPYDIVSIVDLPDDESATAAMLKVGALGNVRTTTLRAFSADDMARIVEKAG